MTRELPHLPHVRRPFTTRITRGFAAAVLALALTASMAMHSSADELDDRQAQLRQQMAEQASVVEDANAQLASAVQAHDAAQSELAHAEAELAKAEAAERAAAELDAQRAAELSVAEAELAQAKADVAAALAALDSVNRRLDEEILVTTQTSHGLLNLAMLFSDVTVANLNQRAQLAETLFDSSALELDELEMRRLMLEDAQAAADAAEQAAQAAREAAAEQLAASEAAAESAASLRAQVTRLVAQTSAAEANATSELAAEEGRQAALAQENAAVEQRIRDRIAAQKAAAEKAAREAAEKAAAEKAARDAAAREAAAREQAATRSATKATAPAPAPAAAPAPAKTSTSVGSGFMFPVAARITSSYGMRLHPVLGYWKLHDGTDFGAACGTPIRAASSGVVSERYYNAGYGNRLMIDHGRVDGYYVTTGYNHASRYIVGVGQRVSRGQVIGYVGSTGYSTGCHLHLMVWQDGSVVNPMARWFG
ncbi:MAG TPA: M23 family metallopeptidase [Arachnia sp.]|nr:M23 family metallopeptidase [Arachnia sp.]